MADHAGGALFRPIVPHQHSRVTYAELFFDLVFVFAVTQISHTLLAHFTPPGVLQVTLLFLAVWWVWVYTSWITNWLNPEKTPVRLVLWAIALAIEYISPAVRFWIPRYGASSVADWVIEGGHMAERCALFVIIALGESVVVTGATFAELAWSGENLAAFVSVLIGS